MAVGRTGVFAIQFKKIIHRCDFFFHLFLDFVQQCRVFLIPVEVEPANDLPVIIIQQDGKIGLGIPEEYSAGLYLLPKNGLDN
jgi:hypothetical protein